MAVTVLKAEQLNLPEHIARKLNGRKIELILVAEKVLPIFNIKNWMIRLSNSTSRILFRCVISFKIIDSWISFR